MVEPHFHHSAHRRFLAVLHPSAVEEGQGGTATTVMLSIAPNMEVEIEKTALVKDSSSVGQAQG